MNTPFLGRFITAVLCLPVAAVLLGGCSKTGEEHEAGPAREPRIRRGTNGEAIVLLDADTRKRIGLRLASPAAAQWQPEVAGQGRVLDPAPLAGLMTDLVSAHVAATASQQELERLRILAGQTNASVRALQAAEAAAQRDTLLVETLRTRITLGWGGAVLERQDPPAFAHDLAAGKAALVRVDLPAGESLPSPPASARLVPLGDAAQPLSAAFFGVAPAVDPQTQGTGYLFLVDNKPPLPGAALAGYLRVAGDALQGVTVPREAVLRHDGRAWVYLQEGDHGFARREIPLDRPVPGGWFVSGPIGAQDRIVVEGAQTILSQELSGEDFQSGARE